MFRKTIPVRTQPSGVGVRHSADPAVGKCRCGWTAPQGGNTEHDTLMHLYGDLKGAARSFALAGTGLR